MTYKTFENIIKTYKQLTKRCDEFNQVMEKALNISLDGDKDRADSVSFCLFPVEAVDKIIIDILIDEGETREGAEWFVYDGLDQIDNGGTEINDTKINSLEEYFNFIKTGFKKTECKETVKDKTNDIKEENEIFGNDDVSVLRNYAKSKIGKLWDMFGVGGN